MRVPGPTKYVFTESNWSGTMKRILRDNGVKNPEECLRWAFGEEYKLLYLKDLDDQWQQLHPELFVIEGHDCIVESTIRIAKEWQVDILTWAVGEDFDIIWPDCDATFLLFEPSITAPEIDFGSVCEPNVIVSIAEPNFVLTNEDN